MNKKLFYVWLLFTAILFSGNINAQIVIGTNKPVEPFAVLELANKGGLRLPQMTTAERNAFAVQGKVSGEGLTIYNSTTGCVEYWNKTRWISLCDGTSQTTISPAPCINVAANGTGCDQTFSITDPDCPNGPFAIAIVAGSDYASLADVDLRNGSFKMAFRENNSVDTHTVLVRVTSTCTSMYKEFLFSQDAVSCTALTYAAPSISPASPALSVCTGGAVYLSVPANTANLDKLIWTRNGIEIARGVSYITATQKGKYDISMGAVGCNVKSGNERVITESGTIATSAISVVASNNGVLCGTNSVTLTASSSATGTIAWFKNGVEVNSGPSITISGDTNIGQWFAVIKNGSCYSMPSNSISVSKSTSTEQVTLGANDALVNGLALGSFTAFCQGGALDLSVPDKKAGITYTWYNGNDVINTNPFIIPSSQTKISLRMVATDNSGTKCSNELGAIDKSITSGNAPNQPNITGNAVLCEGTTDLTLVPQIAGTYTYTWYKDGIKMAETTPTIKVTTPGVIYSGSVTNTSGCASTLAIKQIAENVSSLPVLSWVSKPATATYGATITLQTAIEFGPAVSYTWTADNGATIIGSGANVSVKLPASGADNTDLKITAVAENSCGKSVLIDCTVTMNNTCSAPIITAQSSQNQDAVQGSKAIVTVSVTGGVNPTYQWYSNTTGSTTVGSPISGATAASYAYEPSAVGTSYLYCIVTNGCVGNLKATSPLFAINTSVNPANLDAGSGTFAGRTCFDIAESNDNNSCGTLISRVATKADFNLTAVNTQTYTFTPSGAVSKVRFSYVELLSGVVVKSITNNGNPTALNVSGAVTATVVYQKTLSTSGGVRGAAFGKATADALSVELYVVYNDKSDGTGKDVMIKLKAQIKDCACCGAMVSPTVWKNFMCHNLGADQSLDPLTPNPGLYGSYYAWGNNTPINVINGGAVNGVKDGWTNNPKGPCPDGYRFMARSEWSAIFANNKRTFVSGQGWFIGSSLFFPVAGRYSAVYGLTMQGSDGRYWDGAPPEVADASRISVSAMTMASTGGTNYDGFTIYEEAKSIRCISEN